MHLLHFFSGIKKNTWRGKTARGFSLLELLVVLSIAIIITTVVLINYPQLGASNALNISVQETVQAIREAQLYGTTVKQANGTSFPAYGIYVGSTNPILPPTYPGKIIIFADSYPVTTVNGVTTVGDGIYTDGQDATDRTLTIDPPNYIDTICASWDVINYYGYRCNYTVGGPIDTTIIFKRPNPEPSISVLWLVWGPPSILPNVSVIKIIIKGPTGQKEIFISKFGQISVGSLK